MLPCIMPTLKKFVGVLKYLSELLQIPTRYCSVSFREQIKKIKLSFIADMINSISSKGNPEQLTGEKQ